MTPKVVAYRLATIDDTADLAGVQLHSALAGFSHIFPPSIPKPTQESLEEEWSAALARPDRTILVALGDDEVCGAVVWGADDDPDFDTDCVLAKLYVHPDWFGAGIGGALHDRAIADLAAAGHTTARLWVLERNLMARRMYERRGWRLRPWFRTDWPGSGILEVGYTLDLLS